MPVASSRMNLWNPPSVNVQASTVGEGCMCWVTWYEWELQHWWSIWTNCLSGEVSKSPCCSTACWWPILFRVQAWAVLWEIGSYPCRTFLLAMPSMLSEGKLILIYSHLILICHVGWNLTQLLLAWFCKTDILWWYLDMNVCCLFSSIHINNDIYS